MRPSGQFAAVTDATPPNVYGFFTESLDDEHEVAVLRGVLSAAREVDATVVCVAGGNVDDPDPSRRAWNFGFDMISSQNVRGLLVMSSAVGNTLGPDGLAAWLGRFGALPSACVGVRVPGRPGVEVDNPGGVRALVLHLVREHRARHLGFVRGPQGSVEAELRLAAFREALREEGLTSDERLIADGDYSKSSGERAIHTIFDERRVPATLLDALVCANDFMALGAVAELGRRGLHVPEDLAVVGFDDVESARTAHPALTTVRQPGELLGRDGMRRLVAEVEGRSGPDRIALPTELVVRRSCGCLPAELALAAQASLPPGRGVETAFMQRRQIILAEVVRASRGEFAAAGAGWEARLIDALVAELRSGEPGAFLRALEHCLRRLEHGRANVDAMQDVLSALRRQSLPCVEGDPVARNRFEQALHDARVATATFVRELEATRVRQGVAHFRNFERRVRSAMIESPESLSAVTAAALPALGVEACVVGALERSDAPSGAARFVLGFGRGGTQAQGGLTTLAALLGHPLLERASRTLVVLPIALEARPLGAAILSVTQVDGNLLEDLRDFFTTVLAVRGLRGA